MYSCIHCWQAYQPSREREREMHTHHSKTQRQHTHTHTYIHTYTSMWCRGVNKPKMTDMHVICSFIVHGIHGREEGGEEASGEGEKEGRGEAIKARKTTAHQNDEEDQKGAFSSFLKHFYLCVCPGVCLCASKDISMYVSMYVSID